MPGDQSPLNGGAIRARLLAESGIAEAVTYCFHDTDAPWIQDGGVPRVVGRRWPDYWSLAARIPFSPSIPKLKRDPGVQNEDGSLAVQMREDLNIEHGLLRIHGPATSETIASLARHPSPLGDMLRELHEHELAAVRRIADLLGIPYGVNGPLPTCISDVVPAVKQRLQGTNVHVTTSLQFWREQGVRLHTIVPPNEYWCIDEAGLRKKWDGTDLGSGQFLVPGALVRSLEEASIGITDCFTSQPYADRIIELRNQYLHELKLPYVQVTLNWELENVPDPVGTLVGLHRKHQEGVIAAKIAKATEPYGDYSRPFPASKKPANKEPRLISSEYAAAVTAYWRSRPTSIAHEVLGGTITASFQQGVR